MTKTSRHPTNAWLLRPAVLLVLGWLAVSCATTIRPPQAFLFSTDDSSNQWLDTVVDVDVAEVRIIHLPLTDAFSGMKLAITRADAPVESLKVSLYASGVTRRQALWLLAEKYGLQMSVAPVNKQSPYISISRE
jgi:hypothetical protein